MVYTRFSTIKTEAWLNNIKIFFLRPWIELELPPIPFPAPRRGSGLLYATDRVRLLTPGTLFSKKKWRKEYYFDFVQLCYLHEFIVYGFITEATNDATSPETPSKRTSLAKRRPAKFLKWTTCRQRNPSVIQNMISAATPSKILRSGGAENCDGNGQVG